MISFLEALPGSSSEQLAKLEKLFASVACPYDPHGEWVCVQEPLLPKRSAGGIILIEDTQEADRIRNVVGRVRRIGPLCGWDTIAQEHVPDWPHYREGDLVRLSPHSHTRFQGGDESVDGEPAFFRLVAWRDIMASFRTAYEVLRVLRQ